MSSQPPSNKPPVPNSGSGSAPRRVYRAEDFGLVSDEALKKRKNQRSPKDNVYRWFFPIGMILGGMISLVLPIKPLHVTISDHPLTIPMVGWLNVPERVVLYMVIVIASGFFWAKQVSQLAEKYFLRKDPNDDLYQQDYQTLNPDGPVFRLDDDE